MSKKRQNGNKDKHTCQGVEVHSSTLCAVARAEGVRLNGNRDMDAFVPRPTTWNQCRALRSQQGALWIQGSRKLRREVKHVDIRPKLTWDSPVCIRMRVRVKPRCPQGRYHLEGTLVQEIWQALWTGVTSPNQSKGMLNVLNAVSCK